MSEDTAALNERMLTSLRERGYLRSDRIAEAFRAVPRHLFVPDEPIERVYSGEAIPTRRDAQGMPTSSSSEPGVMAVMLEQLEPSPGQRWLEIGAGTGYNAAVIAWLVRPNGAVTTIDIDEDIARSARKRLDVAGFPEVDVRAGDGWLGAEDRAPFGRIEVTASVEDLSPHWVAQLAADGRLLVPLSLRGVQLLVAFRREGETLVSASVRGGGFMRLRGPHGAPFRRLGVTIDDWSIALADDDVHLATLAELVRSAPRALPAPVLPKDAGSCIAFEDAGAVTMWRGGRFVFGIYDERAKSLALLEDGRLAVRGSDAAGQRFREWAAGARSVEALRVEAIRSDRWNGRAGPRTFRREHFTFVVG